MKEHMQFVGVKMPKEIIREMEKVTQNKSQFIRGLVETNLQNGENNIKSGDWKALRKEIDKQPGLLIHGVIGVGKSHTIKEVLENNKETIFVLFDVHNEHTEIPSLPLNTFLLKPKLKESKRIILSDNVRFSQLEMTQIIDYIFMRRIPSDYILIFEEAVRNSEILEKLCSEVRKFNKCIFISAKKIYDFVPTVQII